jgi:hypothetical protein
VFDLLRIGYPNRCHSTTGLQIGYNYELKFEPGPIAPEYSREQIPPNTKTIPFEDGFCVWYCGDQTGAPPLIYQV